MQSVGFSSLQPYGIQLWVRIKNTCVVLSDGSKFCDIQAVYPPGQNVIIYYGTVKPQNGGMQQQHEHYPYHTAYYGQQQRQPPQQRRMISSVGI